MNKLLSIMLANSSKRIYQLRYQEIQEKMVASFQERCRDIDDQEA